MSQKASKHHGHNVLRLFDILIFFWPQVKWSVIISNSNGIPELPCR